MFLFLFFFIFIWKVYFNFSTSAAIRKRLKYHSHCQRIWQRREVRRLAWTCRGNTECSFRTRHVSRWARFRRRAPLTSWQQRGGWHRRLMYSHLTRLRIWSWKSEHKLWVLWCSMDMRDFSMCVCVCARAHTRWICTVQKLACVKFNETFILFSDTRSRRLGKQNSKQVSWTLLLVPESQWLIILSSRSPSRWRREREETGRWCLISSSLPFSLISTTHSRTWCTRPSSLR